MLVILPSGTCFRKKELKIVNYKIKAAPDFTPWTERQVLKESQQLSSMFGLVVCDLATSGHHSGPLHSVGYPRQPPTHCSELGVSRLKELDLKASPAMGCGSKSLVGAVQSHL